jgi:hypothetical protein
MDHTITHFCPACLLEVVAKLHPSQLGEGYYAGEPVPLGTVQSGDVKSFKVHVKDLDTGKTKKIEFGKTRGFSQSGLDWDRSDDKKDVDIKPQSKSGLVREYNALKELVKRTISLNETVTRTRHNCNSDIGNMPHYWSCQTSE